VVARTEPDPLADHAGARMTWSSAGHPPPILLRPDGTVTVLAGAQPNLLLGIDPATHRIESELDLEPGSTVLLYTDGLIERRGEHLETGMSRLASAAADGPLGAGALCDRLLAAAVPTGATTDDVALLTLSHVPLGSHLELDMPSEPSALGSLRGLLRRWLAQVEASDADVHAIVMACGEACTNAIEHSGAAADETIAFTAVLHDGEVEVTVSDRGRWREHRPPSEQGRGLDLIEALMDEVDVAPGPHGTTVRLRRRLTARVEA
jgi:anti-sigma regulatory factor (Ser/Thr protein kinase)